MIKVFIPRQDLYNAGRDSLMFSNPLWYLYDSKKVVSSVSL